MLNFTIYTADCVGNSGNCLYPNKMIVTDKESFIKATKMDHTTIKVPGTLRNHRSTKDTELLKDLFEKLGFQRKELKTVYFNVDTEYESYQDRYKSWKRRFKGFISTITT